MRTRTLAAVFGLTALTLAAASPALAADARFKPAHNGFGQPDISGVWTNATVTDLERPREFGDRLVLTPEEVKKLEGDATAYRAAGDVQTDPNAPAPTDGNTNLGYNRGWTDPGTLVMRVGGQPRSSFITTTKDGRVPPRKAGAPQVRTRATPSEFGGAAGRADNPEDRGLPERCIHMPTLAGPVMRSVLYNNNYQIVQGRDTVAIWIEMIHDVRVIRIGGQHRRDGVRDWLGDSIGWYDGDSLVVETTGYHPAQTFYGASEKLKVTERFTRVAKDRLLYQFTVEDPLVWDTTWGGEYEFGPSQGIFEYACHEGNYGLHNILAGARAEERRAAAGQ